MHVARHHDEHAAGVATGWGAAMDVATDVAMGVAMGTARERVPTAFDANQEVVAGRGRRAKGEMRGEAVRRHGGPARGGLGTHWAEAAEPGLV